MNMEVCKSIDSLNTQPIRPGQIKVGIIGHSFVKRMSKYISQDRSRRWSNLDLPVAQFKVRMQGRGGLTMEQLRSWSPLAASAAVFCTQPHVILLKHREI